MSKKKFLIFVIILVFLIVLAYIFINIWGQGNKSMYDKISTEFDKNYSTYLRIADFIENETESFHCEKTPERLIVRLNSQAVDINSISVGTDLLFILDTLRYRGIFKDRGDIWFIKQAGTDESGIIFKKDNKEPDSKSFYKIVLIKENWYYYERHHT